MMKIFCSINFLLFLFLLRKQFLNVGNFFFFCCGIDWWSKNKIYHQEDSSFIIQEQTRKSSAFCSPLLQAKNSHAFYKYKNTLCLTHLHLPERKSWLCSRHNPANKWIGLFSVASWMSSTFHQTFPPRLENSSSRKASWQKKALGTAHSPSYKFVVVFGVFTSHKRERSG